MIDTHCHLGAKEFRSDLLAVIERAEKRGVGTIVTIGDSVTESEECLKIAEIYEQVFCTVGIHPHHAERTNDQDLERIRVLAESSHRVRAIGEIGLDYHYSFSPREAQHRVFRRQLEIAKDLHLPSVIHCREALEDVWKVVDEVRPSRIVLHCCSERWGDVERFIDAGHILSFTGIITYPKATHILDTVRHCPLAQLMIETDAPFLAPIPFRGKRNEPAYVVEVATKIAEIKKISIEEVDRITTENARRFFGME